MAIFDQFTPATASYRYDTDLYRAINDGADFSSEDVIEATKKINEATGVIVETTWFNISTASPIAAPSVKDLHAYDGYRALLKSENIKFNDASPTNLTAIPDSANHAEVHIWSEDPADVAVITLDGSVPAVQNGFRQNDGSTFELESADELATVQLGSLSANTSIAHIQYFYQSKRNA